MADADDDRNATFPDNIGALRARAQLFHRMIMEENNFLLAALHNSGHYDATKLNADELETWNKVKEFMKTKPRAKVDFPDYSFKSKLKQELQKQSKKVNVLAGDFRTRKFLTRMSKWPPFSIYAHWLITTKFFGALMISVICMNSILMAVDGELDDNSDKNLRYAIDGLDFFFLAIFLTEIALHWSDDFKGFWTEYWNIFDFTVTLMSLVAPVLDIITQGSAEDDRLNSLITTVKYIRILRILRSLNVVTRIRKIMVIWAAITRTARSLLFITVLMLIFFYIFAIIGVQLFDKFNKSHRNDLEYKDAFRNLPNAMVTLFQLFTLDKWYYILTTLGDGMGSMFIPCAYGLIWILLGSFIFANIFVGVMVNNFQNIRKELYEIQQRLSLKAQLASQLDIFELDEIGGLPVVDAEADDLVDFENHVFHNLQILAACEEGISPTMWPRDTLFRYLCIIESLTSNVDERDKIHTLLNEALLRLYE